MGINAITCGGYLLPLTENTIKDLMIDFNDYKEQIEIYKSQGMDTLSAIENVVSDEKEILVTCNVNGKQLSIFIFRYEEELGSELDSLEDGWYILFREIDLYTKTLNTTGQFLKDKNQLPFETNWISPL